MFTATMASFSSNPLVFTVSTLVAVALFDSSSALDNGLGQRPGLGWNSDYCTNCSNAYGIQGADADGKLRGFQNEGFIRHIADYMHTHVLPNGKTMQQLGYEYINMDASWNLKTRDANGDLQPNPALWPSGIDTTINYVHSLGLKFGLYGDRGTKDCAGNPGALGHEKNDANFFARNKVDWYKEDNCYAQGDKYAQYGAMRDALNATGYPIWFALCGWSTADAAPPNAGYPLANSARIGPDTGTGWTAVIININGGLETTQFTGPKGSGGFWADGSLMLTPGMGHDAPNHMTNEKHRAQFSAWAILGMNILTVGNFSALNSYVMDTWTNEEVLAVNQDVKGYPAVRINSSTRTNTNTLESTAYRNANVQECGGEPTLQQWGYNSSGDGFLMNNASQVCLNVEGCATNVIYDGCVRGDAPTCGTTKKGFHPNEAWTFDCEMANKCQVKTQLADHACLTVVAGGVVRLSTCLTPAPQAQTWSFDTTTHQLLTGDGMCLTAASPPPPTPSGEKLFTIGRRLETGAAVFFLNNGNSSTTMMCDSACFAAVALTGTQSMVVRDLYLHQEITTTTPSTGFNVTVAAGASRIFTLVAASE